MKLYTIRQCYEALGSKFPFTADWHYEEYKEKKCIKNVVFIDYKDDKWFHENTILGSEWFQYGDKKIEESDFSFDYKTPEYNDDFDKLIK